MPSTPTVISLPGIYFSIIISFENSKASKIAELIWSSLSTFASPTVDPSSFGFTIYG